MENFPTARFWSVPSNKWITQGEIEALEGERLQAAFPLEVFSASEALPEIQAGLLIQVPPGRSFVNEGRDCYKAGDTGRVTKVERDEAYVEWDRSGQVTATRLTAFRGEFRILQEECERKKDEKKRARRCDAGKVAPSRAARSAPAKREGHVKQPPSA